MQPDHNDNWQLPSEQPSKTPYTPIQDPDVDTAPVVTMTAAEVAPQSQGDLSGSREAPKSHAPASPGVDQPVHWQATEYIERGKNTLWFVMFGVAIIVLMAIAIFLMNSLTFAVLVPVMAVALIVYIRRPPRVLNYTLSRQGLHINDHLYSFSEFKGFGVIHDGEEYSVMLIPIKRFHQGVSVYFPEESGEAIVDMLGARLPMQELHLDVIDMVLRKLRI
jgi:hypothetical protein